jgi:hypothetical protein
VFGAFGLLEEQRRPAGLHRAIDDLGDLEVGIDLGGDSDELALALEQCDPVAEVLSGHGASLRTASRQSRWTSTVLRGGSTPRAEAPQNIGRIVGAPVPA